MGEYTEAAARDAALRVANNAGLGSNPSEGMSHYPDEATRQASLSWAEQANIRDAATNLGVSLAVYEAAKKRLGRSPMSKADFEDVA